MKYDISFKQNYQELGMPRLIGNTLREVLRSDALPIIRYKQGG